jgi:hypothetical protein
MNVNDTRMAFHSPKAVRFTKLEDTFLALFSSELIGKHFDNTCNKKITDFVRFVRDEQARNERIRRSTIQTTRE